MAWPCYLIKPTTRGAVTLRRLSTCAWKICPLNEGFHQAQKLADNMPWPPHPEWLPNADWKIAPGSTGTQIEFPHDDHRWPTHCACGYEFDAEEDRWQPTLNRLFMGDIEGQPIAGVFGSIGPTLPPGALWYVERTDGRLGHLCKQGRPGPDGKYLAVMLPRAVEFLIDGPAWKGQEYKPCPWTRSGRLPNLTVTPSINIEGIYHGYIAAGVVSDDCEGRQFDENGRAM